jgi:protein-disulfide isomerase
VAEHASRPVNFPKKRQAAKRPRSRASLYLAAAASAVLMAAALVIASQLGNPGTTHAAPASSALTGVGDNASLLAGIPQRGAALGSPKAPVTLVEYADLQCPYCGEFARTTLPTLVQQYVRTGKVRFVFRGLAFVGPESEVALRAALAAGQQNRLWNFTHLTYENQGAENSGWVTDGFIRSVASEIAGLDATRLVAAASSQSVTDQIAAAQQLATNDGVNSTPSFLVGRTGGALTRLDVGSLDPGAFRPTLDKLLKG